MKNTLTERAKGRVTFQYYRDNTLWYKTDDGFLFEVPLSDTGTATFNAEDKGIFFMRWIRKAMDTYNAALKEQMEKDIAEGVV